jgi:hypothetical protein
MAFPGSDEGAVWEPSFLPLQRTTARGTVTVVDSVGLVLPTSLCSGQIADMVVVRLNERLARERALTDLGPYEWHACLHLFPRAHGHLRQQCTGFCSSQCADAVWITLAPSSLPHHPDDDSSPFRVLLSRSVTRFVALVHTEVRGQGRVMPFVVGMSLGSSRFVFWSCVFC